MAALHAHQGRDPAGCEDLLHVVGGRGQGERVRIAPDHRAHRVDLLEGRRDGVVALQRAGYVDRPELRAHAAGP